MIKQHNKHLIQEPVEAGDAPRIGSGHRKGYNK